MDLRCVKFNSKFVAVKTLVGFLWKKILERNIAKNSYPHSNNCEVLNTKIITRLKCS